MAEARSFRNLSVWAKSHELTLLIYRATKAFPKEEIFGLVSQMRRSAVSIPANIAEGYKRTGNLDKIRFYNIAQSSLEELKYYIILSNDLGYNLPTESAGLSEEVSKMLESYIKKMKENLSIK